jgi:hypothetical protein
MSLGLFQNPLLLLGRQGSRSAFIGPDLGNKSGKAAALVIIPPVFNRPWSKQPLSAIGQPNRRTGRLFQGYRKRETLAQKILDFSHEGKALQRERLRRGSFRFRVHDSPCSLQIKLGYYG